MGGSAVSSLLLSVGVPAAQSPSGCAAVGWLGWTRECTGWVPRVGCSWRVGAGGREGGWRRPDGAGRVGGLLSGLSRQLDCERSWGRQHV